MLYYSMPLSLWLIATVQARAISNNEQWTGNTEPAGSQRFFNYYNGCFLSSQAVFLIAMRLFVSQAVLLIALRVAGLAVFHFIKERWSLYFPAPQHGESRNWLLWLWKFVVAETRLKSGKCFKLFFYFKRNPFFFMVSSNKYVPLFKLNTCYDY